MHPDLLNILSNQENPIDNEKLIAYLTGHLGAAESQQLEAQLAASGLDQEALEGLMLVEKSKLPAYHHELSQFLKSQVKPEKRKRRKLAEISWGWLAAGTAALILLAILLWYVVHFLSTRQ